MTEIKSRITKRFSGVVRSIFPRRRRTVDMSNLPKVNVRRSLSVRDRTVLTESAVWRHNVEQLCQEYDDNQRTEAMGYEARRPADSLTTVRLQTKVYRDELSDLKREAILLKRQRDGLSQQMNNIRAQHEHFQQAERRRKSFAVSPFHHQY